MPYQKRHNKHKIWKQYCEKHNELIEALNLPKWIFIKEDNFRDFATTGQISDDENVVFDFELLSKEDFWKLWSFANSYFDMDMILFDKFEKIRVDSYN